MAKKKKVVAAPAPAPTPNEEDMAVLVVRNKLAPLTSTSRIVAKGSLPNLPSGGSVAKDPTWGLPIMRVTDSSDGTDANRHGTVYPDMQSLNYDNTLVTSNVETANSKTVIYGIDPVAFTRGTNYTFPTGYRGEAGGWSRSNRNYFYCPVVGAAKIARIDWSNPASPAVTTWDFAGIGGIGATDILNKQMAFDDSEDIFSCQWFTSGNVEKGFAVVKLSTNTVLRTVSSTNMNNSNVTRDGLYLFSRYTAAASGILDRWIRLSDGVEVATITEGSPDWGIYHFDVAAGNAVCGISGEGDLRIWTVATAHSPTSILANALFQNTYTSAGGSDVLDGAGKRNVLIAFLNHGIGAASSDDVADSVLMSGEFVEVPTDGSGTVRRWGRHYSVLMGTHPSGDNYWNYARPNLSTDHKFISFSSNMGNNGGPTDLYILKLS